VSVSSSETRKAEPRLNAGNGQVVFLERPSLAPGVTLAGQMKESAFKEPPWLIEREEAGYVQVPELLYRIAEQCDGAHTIDEIATSVSETTGQNIPPDAVHRLIAGQLIQKGLVATGDGRVAITNRLASPLALNMRMAMVNPRLLHPITRVLQVLYWPPVLLTVLALAAAAQVWLYFVHGVGSSLHDIIYAPGLMLILLGVIVVSAAFHELGHAAALRYGGGEVRAMGAGLYLVYPAFYTDVSDNYRLPRWARLRTDLGGFYFNMIFALGAMALYVASGQEFLLLIVVLINLEIIHQLFPFLRLDGYWTLVDMTGVPDFFSQMAAFTRRFIPGLRGSGPKLPELKWWANLIFALYILITIPLLAFLFFVIVKGFPRIVATAWDSFLQQKDVLAASLGSGDALGVATASVNILTLALPTLGAAMAISTTARRVFGALWRWSAESLQRRTGTLVGTAAAVVGVLLLWAPQLPLAASTPGPLYQQARFQPIQRDERLTVSDMGVPGVPRPEPQATSEPTAVGALAVEMTPTADVTPAVTPQPRDGDQRGGAAATSVRGLPAPAPGTQRPITPAPSTATTPVRPAETRPATPPIASPSPAVTP